VNRTQSNPSIAILKQLRLNVKTILGIIYNDVAIYK
jgi:hypothetical protein